MTSGADELARWVWDERYRWHAGGQPMDADLDATFERVAAAVAATEAAEATLWRARFRQLLEGFRFIPGGRILAGAGTSRRVTLLNCFVMGVIEDSMHGIFRALEESALTLQHGGGIGCDFSTLRPRGAYAASTGTTASGPVSFMHVWNSMCATVLASGSRRGAMMATLRCDHPDVIEFIEAKLDPQVLRFFNVSVQVSDEFLAAVRDDVQWPLVFPASGDDVNQPRLGTVMRRWTGTAAPVECRIHAFVPAREVWNRLLRASHASSEPGVLFVDTINRENNLGWFEHLSATNPCGEIPLPAYGACDLGSINLVRFVAEPFTAQACLDRDAVRTAVAGAVRFLDDVIDVSRYPLPQQQEQARYTRRLGLGITGLADALIMLGLRYDSAQARELAAQAMRLVCETAYQASTELAALKGPFPAFDRERCLAQPFIARLPWELRDRIATVGLRNSHLTTIAPAGTISLLAGNVSSGIEPVFELEGTRRVIDHRGVAVEMGFTDFAWRLWRQRNPGGAPPEAFVTATQIDPQAHMLMQAALQPWVDAAISKTINLPAGFPFGSYSGLYERAHQLGLKGCTTYRPGTERGQVISLGRPAVAAELADVERCCSV